MRTVEVTVCWLPGLGPKRDASSFTCLTASFGSQLACETLVGTEGACCSTGKDATWSSKVPDLWVKPSCNFQPSQVSSWEELSEKPAERSWTLHSWPTETRPNRMVIISNIWACYTVTGNWNPSLPPAWLLWPTVTQQPAGHLRVALSLTSSLPITLKEAEPPSSVTLPTDPGTQPPDITSLTGYLWSNSYSIRNALINSIPFYAALTVCQGLS